MKLSDAVAWFDEIAQRNLPRDIRQGATRLDGSIASEYNHKAAVALITESESALRAVFPPGHPVVQRWNAIFSKSGADHVSSWSTDDVVDAARAVFESAKSQLKAGRIGGLIDSIKVSTVGDLLDQADALLAGKYTAAAMVVAGGSLETFLRHLCERNTIQWKGIGSITAYEVALGQARNAGNEIISATDGKLVTSWGGMRNDAAHSPATFGRSESEVGMVIMQIREFLARHSQR
ncbi:hypothetical protein HI113_40730 [Corallococcus exiguus]|uniref:hypothetical protein n=1 Tax=Corallococcus exiguus TaxID=83462 RepID=UPI00147491CE|nr:hypothetical protein [Corallococcus exiguus]NNC00212.1 hypothetical protein [Corallococcus exiguus]